MAQKRVPAICLVFLPFVWPALAQESPLRQAARLDAELKCAEAERLYRNALSHGAASLALLNNLGNHYMLCGDAEKARSYFERVLKVNPQHANANLQLARIAIDLHQGARALDYLARVNDSSAPTRMLRAEALHWAGKPDAALAELDRLAQEDAADQRLKYLYALTCARIGAYSRAETAFNALLAQRPDDFEVLFNLGRTAARATHYDRARHALEGAVKLRPDHVDSLLELGQISAALGDYARAIYVLAQARRLAPGRPEISLALARAAQAGEFYGDAALAYDEYLRFKPGDDMVSRDRALVSGFTDARQAEGMKEMARYVQKHPEDPVGHYDLAQLTWRDRPEQALEQLQTALKLDPRFSAAYVDAGWLLNRMGRTQDALPHFEKAVEIDPRDARALDQLGAAYLAVDRPADAEKVLRRAVVISPGDPEIQMHLGRALLESGRDEEGRRLLSEFQKNRRPRSRGPWRQPGMIESASLPAEERGKRDIERLRQDARAHPDDPELQLRLASLLLSEGRVEEALAEFRLVLTGNVESRTYLQAGTFLLSHDQYPLAREFLERAAAADPATNLDLAVAIFYSEGPEKALQTLDGVPDASRSGDYFLLKADLLDASGRKSEVESLLEQGLRLPISRQRLIRAAALLLVRHDRKREALEVLTKTAGNDPDLLLMRSMVLALSNGQEAAERALREIELQWPEWDRPYLVHALLLEQTQPREARRRLQIALALGSREPAAQCAAARLASAPVPDAGCSCAMGIRELLLPQCPQN